MAAGNGEFDGAFRQQLDSLMQWRRDVRRFRTDPVPAPLLQECLDAFLLAPSVGLSEPWRVVQVNSGAARQAALSNYQAANERALDGYSGEGVLPLVVYEMWSRVAQRGAPTSQRGDADGQSVEAITVVAGPDAGKQVSRDARGVVRVAGSGVDEKWSCKTKRGLRDGALCSCAKPRSTRR